MLKTLTTLLLLCLVATADTKKDDGRTKVFTEPYDKVWAACIASASQNFILDHSDKESSVITFHSGISFTSAGFAVSVTVTKVADDKIEVRLNPQAKGIGNWGAGGRIAKKYFKGVETALKKGN